MSTSDEQLVSLRAAKKNGAAAAPAITRERPTDLAPLPAVASASPTEIAHAVAQAREAQAEWAALSLQQRIEALTRAAKRLLARRDEAIALVHDEMGKLEPEALFNEALGPLDAVSGWARVIKRAATTQSIRLNPLAFPRKQAQVDFVPRGVVGVIAPWNYPVAGLYRSLFPALMTGNGVVVKPSEFTPRSTEWLVENLAAELPAGLCSVVHGDGRVGAQLVDAGIDACVFTGSVKTGRLVRIQCAERGIPSSIEMGGNDPAIVLPDCDLDRTVAAITHWTLSNVGQACGAIEIVFVEQSIASEFVARAADAFRSLRAAPGAGGQVDLSPLAHRRQLDVVQRHVDDAVAKGARLVTGGKPTGVGLFYPATLLDHCDESMEVVSDETFGPVLAVVRVDGAADAIRRANALAYGLGASIWCADEARARRLAERLDYGVVSINNHSFTGAIPSLPWSGTRATGFGVANSQWSLPTFVRPRTLVVDSASGPEPFWLPFDDDLVSLGKRLCEAQLMKLTRAWEIPLLLRKRAKTVRDLFWR